MPGSKSSGMKRTRCSTKLLVFIRVRFVEGFQIGDVQDQMIIRNMFEIEAPHLFVSNNHKRCIQRIQFRDLDADPIHVIRRVFKLSYSLVTDSRAILRRKISCPHHTSEAIIPPVQAHAGIDEGYALRQEQFENLGARASTRRPRLARSKMMEEIMRVLPLRELMRLTRNELCGLKSEITTALPDYPEGSHEQADAERGLHNIHRVLAWYDLAPE
jgi:hypothetical protein